MVFSGHPLRTRDRRRLFVHPKAVFQIHHAVFEPSKGGRSRGSAPLAVAFSPMITRSTNPISPAVAAAATGCSV